MVRLKNFFRPKLTPLFRRKLKTSDDRVNKSNFIDFFVETPMGTNTTLPAIENVPKVLLLQIETLLFAGPVSKDF